MTTKTFLLLVLSIVFGLDSCKKAIDSVDSQVSLEEESRRINSTYAAESLMGDYTVVLISWYKDGLSGYRDEGYYTYEAPDTNFLKSHYIVKLRPTKLLDSLTLTIIGDGFGGKFDNYKLGTYSLLSFDGLTANNAGYTYSSWLWGSKGTGPQVFTSRRAFPSRTDLVCSFVLSKGIDKNRSDFNSILMNDESRSAPAFDQKSELRWAGFTCTRRSPASLIFTK
jgi:hypothetical protein